MSIFDIAGRELSRAMAAAGPDRASERGRSIDRVLQCFNLLQGSLDMERGREVASNLDRIYSYLQRRLTQAHLAGDETIFAEVARHVGELGAAWREAAQRPVPTGPTRHPAMAQEAR